MHTALNSDVRVPLDKPPDMANAWMRWALKTRGIQNLIGQQLALLSFKGRRTGKLYTIVVGYHRHDDIVTIITKRQRRWWRNFETPMQVELRLAGDTYMGKAEIQTDEVETLDFMTDYLQKRPVDARAFGLAKNERTKDKIARIIPHIVMIRIGIVPDVQRTPTNK
ncbi:MAG TPA: nitroreductase/quinone reductase family protein [Acidimicrobiia bacterium]|jgi:hypothetical protein